MVLRRLGRNVSIPTCMARRNKRIYPLGVQPMSAIGQVSMRYITRSECELQYTQACVQRYPFVCLTRNVNALSRISFRIRMNMASNFSGLEGSRCACVAASFGFVFLLLLGRYRLPDIFVPFLSNTR